MARPRRELAISPTKLMLIRKMFFMTMSEAAEVLCDVRQRSYHQYETGIAGMPAEAEARVLSAIDRRKLALHQLDSDSAEQLRKGLMSITTLDQWLTQHNPNHKELLDCKLAWYVDISVKAEYALKHNLDVQLTQG